MASPLEQFKIKTIGSPITAGGIDLSFTNSALFMVLSVLLVISFLFLSTRKILLKPNKTQMLVESVYSMIMEMVGNNLGKKEEIKYFSIVFTIFLFILAGNLLGIIPYSFTFSSHIAVTFVMAFFVVLLTTIIGFYKHGFKFFGIFLPKGVPIAIAPLIIPIEIISYFSRVLSLSVRLFANMVAGHTMLKIFATFAASSGIIGILPLTMNVGLIGFEIFIAFIQSYIFAILTCVYLSDGVNMH